MVCKFKILTVLKACSMFRLRKQANYFARYSYNLWRADMEAEENDTKCQNELHFSPEVDTTKTAISQTSKSYYNEIDTTN